MPTSTVGRSSEGCRRARDASSGFTLLELAVVLLILGIAVSFLAPRLRDPDTMALASSVRRLATTARYLYDEAAYQRVPMRLNLDLDHQTYFVTVLGGDPDAPEFVPARTALARPVTLPDAVAFSDVVLPAVGTVTEGIVFAQFSPDGWADPWSCTCAGAPAATRRWRSIRSRGGPASPTATWSSTRTATTTAATTSGAARTVTTRERGARRESVEPRVHGIEPQLDGIERPLDALGRDGAR